VKNYLYSSLNFANMSKKLNMTEEKKEIRRENGLISIHDLTADVLGVSNLKQHNYLSRNKIKPLIDYKFSEGGNKTSAGNAETVANLFTNYLLKSKNKEKAIAYLPKLLPLIESLNGDKTNVKKFNLFASWRIG